MFEPFSLNISGRIVEFDRPAVMGILNVTPDSFYGTSRTMSREDICRRVSLMLEDGADIIDIGGYSTRPGAPEVSQEEELRRVMSGMEVVRSLAPEAIISVDTFRSSVARKAAEEFQADIINDISGGDMDEKMFDTVADTGAAYIAMHTRGCPATMQQLTDYDDVVAEVISSLSSKVRELALRGVADVIVDPGLGFAKTVEQNYYLLEALEAIKSTLERPILIGLSRKSMITKPLGITADEALAPTTALNLAALERGASIIRVHDVKEAVMAVKLYMMLKGL
ncbi:MAG: dihydropteroate synthase [Lachnoclostridium sp.]|nr:dihydropteroate synthase [Lachnoclostridium sp.]